MPREQKRRRPEREERAEFDSGLGGVFKGIGDFIDLLSDMMEKGETIRSRTGEIPGLREGARGVYGFNVRMGLGGTPQVEHFGNVRTTERGPEVAEVREPMVDVFDEDDAILVVAELPGLDEADIEVEVKGDVLSLSTSPTAPRKYAREALLPAAVDAASQKLTFKNGVLELRFKKAGAAPRKRRPGTKRKRP